MEKWTIIALLLCSYGCIKEIRPSESFLTEYLEGPWINLTNNQVNHLVYPVWTYTYMSVLVLVFLFTDLVRYKPIIIVGSICYIICWCLLLWTKGVLSMQLMQFVYGIATASEIAYYTYIYSVVTGDVYQKVTSYTKAAILVGRFLSGFLSQILVSTNTMDYRQLNIISLTSVSISFVVAILLPASPSSIYFHKVTELHEDDKLNNWCRKLKVVVQTMASELRNSYINKHILKWSIWWAFATCGDFQIGNYIQPLWEEVLPSMQNYTFANESNQIQIYNGAVEASYTVLGAGIVYMVSFSSLNWYKWDDLILAIVTILDAIILLFMSQAKSIWICYIGYIIIRICYQALMTVIRFHITRFHTTQ